MAKTSILTMSVSISGDGTSDTWAPSSAVQNTAAPAGGTTSIALSAGANTITVPAGAKGFICIPQASSANAKTLKGVSGDTGVAMGRARPTPFVFDEAASAPATIVVNSVGSETVDWLWL